MEGRERQSEWEGEGRERRRLGRQSEWKEEGTNKGKKRKGK